MASIAVQVTKGEQTAHSSRAYRARSCSRTEGSAPAGRLLAAQTRQNFKRHRLVRGRCLRAAMTAMINASVVLRSLVGEQLATVTRGSQNTILQVEGDQAL